MDYRREFVAGGESYQQSQQPPPVYSYPMAMSGKVGSVASNGSGSGRHSRNSSNSSVERVPGNTGGRPRSRPASHDYTNLPTGGGYRQGVVGVGQDRIDRGGLDRGFVGENRGMDSRGLDRDRERIDRERDNRSTGGDEYVHPNRPLSIGSNSGSVGSGQPRSYSNALTYSQPRHMQHQAHIQGGMEGPMPTGPQGNSKMSYARVASSGGPSPPSSSAHAHHYHPQPHQHQPPSQYQRSVPAGTTSARVYHQHMGGMGVGEEYPSSSGSIPVGFSPVPPGPSGILHTEYTYNQRPLPPPPPLSQPHIPHPQSGPPSAPNSQPYSPRDRVETSVLNNVGSSPSVNSMNGMDDSPPPHHDFPSSSSSVNSLPLHNLSISNHGSPAMHTPSPTYRHNKGQQHQNPNGRLMIPMTSPSTRSSHNRHHQGGQYSNTNSQSSATSIGSRGNYRERGGQRERGDRSDRDRDREGISESMLSSNSGPIESGSFKGRGRGGSIGSNSGYHHGTVPLTGRALETQHQLQQDEAIRLLDLAYNHEQAGDATKAFKLYQQAAELGYAKAQSNLGYYYFRGLGGAEQSYEQAVRWFHAAACQGHPHALYRLGYCFEYNLGIGASPPSSGGNVTGGNSGIQPPNLPSQWPSVVHSLHDSITKAVRCYELASERGHISATCCLAYHLFHGHEGFVQIDHTRSYELYCFAARLGHPDALFGVGFFCLHGVHPLPGKDLPMARYYFEQTLKRTFNPDAIFLDAYCCEVSQNMAILHSQQVAHFNHEQSAGNNPVPPPPPVPLCANVSPQLIAEIYRLASESQPCAQNNYAIYLQHGLHNPQAADPQRAFRLFTRAAEQNLLEGIFNLAYCFHHGIGIEQDLTTATMYYEKVINFGPNLCHTFSGSCLINDDHLAPVSPAITSEINTTEDENIDGSTTGAPSADSPPPVIKTSTSIPTAMIKFCHSSKDVYSLAAYNLSVIFAASSHPQKDELVMRYRKIHSDWDATP